MSFCFFFANRIHPPCGAMTDEEAKHDNVKELWEKTYIKNLKYSAQRLQEVKLIILQPYCHNVGFPVPLPLLVAI